MRTVAFIPVQIATSSHAVALSKAAHTLIVHCRSCLHYGPKKEGTGQCMEVLCMALHGTMAIRKGLICCPGKSRATC
ncbi:hypothetical protein LSTR_LSTR000502 [Laodelphax striatellus]|uniref:Uncharacterized protein n=1 Tax=Laodelphax striatellus TaxID=195883 RepID=A0A482X1X5_LAOST|nr:hypothetical protein LSTR_LSTR000502 [Laodelphax striatellus]